jgi:hypothetical protein
METGASNILLKINFSPSSPNNLLTEKCHLSVEIGLNNFSYCLFDTLTFTYILLKKFEFEAKGNKESCEKITNNIASEELLQKEFYSSSLAFNNFPSTLVPTPFYKEEKNREILSFNHEIEEVLTDKMHQMDAVNIYSVPTELLNLINKSFPNTQKKCNSSILIDQLLFQNEKIEVKAASWNGVASSCILYGGPGAKNCTQHEYFIGIWKKDCKKLFLMFEVWFLFVSNLIELNIVSFFRSIRRSICISATATNFDLRS